MTLLLFQYTIVNLMREYWRINSRCLLGQHEETTVPISVTEISYKTMTTTSIQIVLTLHFVVSIMFSASWKSQKNRYISIRIRFCSCSGLVSLQFERDWSLATVHARPTSRQELRQKPPSTLNMFWVSVCLYLHAHYSTSHWISLTVRVFLFHWPSIWGHLAHEESCIPVQFINFVLVQAIMCCSFSIIQGARVEISTDASNSPAQSVK
jgi:hypothetical protein